MDISEYTLLTDYILDRSSEINESLSFAENKYGCLNLIREKNNKLTIYHEAGKFEIMINKFSYLCIIRNIKLIGVNVNVTGKITFNGETLSNVKGIFNGKDTIIYFDYILYYAPLACILIEIDTDIKNIGKNNVVSSIDRYFLEIGNELKNNFIGYSLKPGQNTLFCNRGCFNGLEYKDKITNEDVNRINTSIDKFNKYEDGIKKEKLDEIMYGVQNNIY